jgi:Transglycosylase SLT domain
MKTQELSKSSSTGLARIFEGAQGIRLKGAGLVMGLIVVSNLFTHLFLSPKLGNKTKADNKLYLLDKAAAHVSDTEAFEEKVREVSAKLEIQPEWLMSVMFSESRFDAQVLNRKGSGAVGLIQWMPATAAGMNTSTAALRQMDHVAQLDYVYKYLQNVRTKYGNYENLTELYLGILFPKAISGDQCFTLYANPSVQYKQNAGLDEDKDGRVTVSDIDRRMQRIYPTAYMKGKTQLAEAQEDDLP